MTSCGNNKSQNETRATQVKQVSNLLCSYWQIIYFDYSRNIDNRETAKYADIFAALGSEPRLEIMRLLFAAYPDGMTVGEIQEKLKITNSTLSHHLEKLRIEELVNSRREKQFLWYSANAETMENLLSFLTTGKNKCDRIMEPINNISTQEGFMFERFF